MLQETLADEITLTGYKAICREKEMRRGLATLIDEKLPYVEHDIHLRYCRLEFILVEIILKRNRGKAQSIFCSNIYSGP